MDVPVRRSAFYDNCVEDKHLLFLYILIFKEKADAHKIISLYDSISSNSFSLAMASPLFTLW